MRVAADRDRCVGAGQCALAAPAVFDQDDEDALVVVLDPHPGADAEAAVADAARGCPVQAITVLAGGR